MNSRQKFYLNNMSCWGGDLRNHRLKRTSRWLSSRKYHHIVFKVNKRVHPTSLRTKKTRSICQHVIKSYAKRFNVRVTSVSIQFDHIHLLIKSNRKINYQSFFRVVAGQIAQRVTDTFHCVKHKESFWSHRPFSRILCTRKSYIIAKAYIHLNELEARKIIPYQIYRLKRATPKLWRILNVDPEIIQWRFVTDTP